MKLQTIRENLSYLTADWTVFTFNFGRNNEPDKIHQLKIRTTSLRQRTASEEIKKRVDLLRSKHGTFSAVHITYLPCRQRSRHLVFKLAESNSNLHHFLLSVWLLGLAAKVVDHLARLTVKIEEDHAFGESQPCWQICILQSPSLFRLKVFPLICKKKTSLSRIHAKMWFSFCLSWESLRPLYYLTLGFFSLPSF